jgi:uncharacterized protein (TIGR00255 family)
MVSMTGYGYAQKNESDYQLTVEFKSYNNRFLEIAYNIPPFFSRFEKEIDKKIKEVAKRGRVELFVRFRNLSSDLNLHVDEEAIRRYAEAFETIRKIGKVGKKASLKDYLAVDGVIISSRDNDPMFYQKAFFIAIEEALQQLKEDKKREGEATKRDLIKFANELENSLSEVHGYANELESRLKNNLVAKLDQLMGDKEYDESRFYQEIALLLTRYSVNEEIVRLAEHISAFKNMVEFNESVGKRLDFLAQEMNREINTIGSKSVMFEVNQIIVKMKESLENIREQVRNIE